MGYLWLYILCLSCIVMMLYSIIWAKKSRCKNTSLYERDLMYNILDQAETMVVIWKDDLSFLNMNHYMKIKLGYEEVEIKKVFEEIFSIDEKNSKKRAGQMIYSSKEIEQIIPVQQGEAKYVMWRSVICRTNKEQVRTILSIGFDITARVQLTKELEKYARKLKIGADIIQKLAFEDELTGLYNKRKFLLEGNILLQNNKEGGHYALMYMVIDKLSFINNIYGQKVGDVLLKQVARQITQLIPNGGLCCTVGEGEFATLFPVAQQSDVMFLYESLASRISKLQIKNNTDYKLELLMGVAIYPEQASDMDELYENVTFVMKEMKTQESKTLQIFDSKIKESILHREVLAMELQEAISNNEFMLYYQPKVDTITQKLVGMEALIRWKHPKNGFMAPGEFIPIAEQTGLIIEIGKWGLMEACMQNKRWQDKGYDKYVVSVNISAIEFYQENMLELIKEALQIADLEAKYLEIELTESMALIDKERTINKLKEIRALGIKIALDDFGTGYSSLSYLKALPIDVLKLDRSFISEIEKDNISKNIILAMIDLAKILNIATVAEGVETKKQAELLKEMGCNMIQGYYYSRPLPPDIFEALYMEKVKE